MLNIGGLKHEKDRGFSPTGINDLPLSCRGVKSGGGVCDVSV